MWHRRIVRNRTRRLSTAGADGRARLSAEVRAWLPAAQALAYARLGNRSDAERVAAEALLRACQDRTAPTDADAFAVRIAAAVRSLCRDPESVCRGAAASDGNGGAADPRLAELRRDVLALDSPAREALLLRHAGGRKPREMAVWLGVSREEASQRLKRGEAAIGPARAARLAEALSPGPSPDARAEAVAARLAEAGVSRVQPMPARAVRLAPACAMVLTAVAAGGMLLAGMARIGRAPEAAVSVPAGEVRPLEFEPAAPAPAPAFVPPVTGAAVDGRVVDADTGEPITEFALAGPDSSRWGQEPAFVSMKDPEGRFHLAGLPEGTVALRVRAPGYAEADATVRTSSGGAPSAAVTLQLKRAAVLEGVVRDPEGRPLPDARIYRGGRVLPDAEDAAAVTDAQGVFRLTDLPPNRLEITVACNGYVAESRLVYPGATPPYEFLLERGERVHGSVRLAGKPLADARVVLSKGLLKISRLEAFTDDDGAFVIEGVPAGTVRVRGEGAGGRRMVKTVDVVPGEDVRVDFDFPELACRVEGVITINGRAPQHSQVEARVRTKSGEERWGPVMTGADGWYRLGPLPMGKAVLRISAVSQDSRPRRCEVPIRLEEGASLRQDIDLKGEGVIEGRLAGLQSGRHARVYAFLGEPEELEIAADAIARVGESAAGRQFMRSDGPFRFEGLEAGRYTLVALALESETPDEVAAAPTALATVDVTPEGTKPVTLRFE
jgi:DNA-directed RNA polymerase specialized sigma24 family protein